MNLKIDDNIYFVSDLHINHRKLCSSCEDHFDAVRNYVTTEEMNEDIVRQWNNTVTNNDIVINLGDQMMNTPGSQCVDVFREYYNKLKFKHMYLVFGNHDHVLYKKLKNVIDEFPRITLAGDYMFINHNCRNYLCQHFDFTDTEFGDPKYLNTLLSEGMHIDYLVHGHTHSSNKLSETKRSDDLNIQNCVCWDAWYKPVNINKLVLARG